MKNNARFPMLRDFARGYLHQDVTVEYGDAMGAAKAYLADLNGTERKALAVESRKFRSQARSWNPDELNRRLQVLGAACNFGSADEFIELLRLFEGNR